MRRPGSTALTRLCTCTLTPLVLAFGAYSCGTREPPRPVHTESAAHVPGDVLYYAHVLYGGETAYLVDGRWYRPGADGWLVFDEEPLELEMLRRTLESE
jgi:hypothetical protein